jgi:hypothetical protein
MSGRVWVAGPGRRGRLVTLIVIGAVAGFGAAAQVRPVPADAVPEPARSILARDIRLSPDQWRRLVSGQVVAGTLDTARRDELTVYGAMRVAMSKEQFFARYLDIARFRRHEGVLQLGRFGSPPSADDVAGLTVEPDTLRGLRTCRPGDCKVKLSAPMMDALRTGVDWSAPGAPEQAQRLFGRLLADLVAAYLREGDVALPVYADKSRPVRLSDTFAGLADRSILAALAPAVRACLAAFPAATCDTVGSVVYWSTDDFDLKPVISATHAVVYRVPGHPNALVGAARQLYASHYFQASLGLNLAVDVGADPERPAIYLVHTNQFSLDAFDGMLGGLRRKITRGRASGKVADALEGLRRTIERDDPPPACQPPVTGCQRP